MSKLWAAHVGYGLFVIRAETAEDALVIALGDKGAGRYGHGKGDLDDISPLELDGPDGVLAEHYG